jgi:hypothetical protein
MPPEKLSMFAVMIASLPLMAMLHPAVPLEVYGWQDALALFAVWGVAFRGGWRSGCRAHATPASTPAGAARSQRIRSPNAGPGRRAELLEPRGLQRGRSGQTTGDFAALNR